MMPLYSSNNRFFPLPLTFVGIQRDHRLTCQWKKSDAMVADKIAPTGPQPIARICSSLIYN
jgi:hypothetical protein